MALTYYLTIDGADGGSLAVGHEGAFEISDYSFDVSAVISAIAGAAGKTTFSPLIVDLAPDSGLTSLLGDVTSGEIIKSIELEGVTSTGETVYDLKLSNVVITDFAISNGVVSLSLDYNLGAVSLTTRPIRSDGSLGTPAIVSWDVAQGAAGAAIASPQASLDEFGGGGAQQYFLTIDRVGGDSGDPRHLGAFVVSDYSFDVNAVVGAIAAGGTAGKPTFPPLTVELTADAGLTALLGDVARGDVIGAIELEGVTSADQTVYDLKLSNVVITDFAINNGVVSLSLDYNLGAVSLTTRPIRSDGSLGTPATVSWDVAQGAVGAAIASPQASLDEFGGGGAQQYFLTIDRVGGDSGDPRHLGAFVVSDYSFDVNAVVGAIAAGGTAGKPTFPPLTVELTADAGLTALLGDVTSGEIIKSIELEGVTSADQTVYDLKLSNVVITDFAISNGVVSLSLDYNLGAVSLTTRPIRSDGSLGTPAIVSWDVAQGAAGAAIASPQASLDEFGGGGAQQYFLTIDRVGGDSGDPRHLGAFVVSDYSFDVNAVVGAIAAGGTAGKPTFPPLTVELTADAGLTALLGDVARGDVIGAIELEGVTSADQTVYDLKLSNVVITDFAISNGVVSLSLDYNLGAVSLTTRPIRSDGSLGTPATVSWDVAQGAVGAAIASPQASLDEFGGGGVQQYFLTIDGADGDSLAAGHAGAFEISDYRFDVSAVVDAIAGRAGKTTFSPLTVDLAPDSGLTSLLGDVVRGEIIKSIELEGVTSTGETVYDLKLSNVVITSLHDSNTGLDSLSFDYSHGAVSLATTPLRPDGSPGAPATVSWNVAQNSADAIIAAPVASSTDTGGGGAQQYFLTIDGLQGDSTDPKRPGAFVVSDYSFDLNAVVGAITGGTAGKPTFPPLTVDLAPDSSLPLLFGDVASGEVIKSVELKGETSTDETVYDLKLSNVVITSFHDSNTGLDGLSFDYSRGTVSLTTTPVSPDGSLESPTTVGWNVATNTPLVGPSVTDTTTAGEEVAHGKTVAIATATAESAGDTLALTKLTGSEAALTLSDGVVRLAVPENVSGVVSFSYQISDQLGGVSAVISDTLTVDPGPSVTDSTTPGEKVGHGTTVAIGSVTPGLAGDTLTLTELTGPAGAVTLSNGIVSLAAPAAGNVAFSYQVSDQLGDVSAIVADTLAVDPGPSVTDSTTAGEKVGHGTTVAIGSVAPGLTGDTLTLTELSGPAGAVTLANGIVSFSTPANASGVIAFSYQISDQLGDVSAVVSDTLAVDPGPKAGNANVFVTAGERVDLTSLLLSQDTPGLSGDTLALTGVGTAGTRGTVSLTNGDLVYTAPASGADMFTYMVSDQLHDTAAAGVDVSIVSNNVNIALAGTGNIVITTNGNRSVSGGTGGSFVSLGNGNDAVSLGGNDNTVVLGDGNDNVTTGDRSTITLGNGNDLVQTGANGVVTVGNGNTTVTAGTGSKVQLGNGNDLVYAGSNSSIVFGNGNSTVFAGSNDTISLGSGHDLVAFGVNPSPPTLGNEIVNGFGKGDTLEFDRQLLSSFATAMSDAKQMGADTVITIGPNDSVTLRGVAVTSLTSNNFKFT